MTALDELVTSVRARLADFTHSSVDGSSRVAAVSVILYDVQGVPQVLVIKRAPRGRNAGQWALPGGKAEPGESPRAAALREASEEVALPPDAAEVIGRLDDYETATGFRITPFVVAARDGWRPRRCVDEVHSLHPIPVSRLASERLPRWRLEPDGARLLQLPLRHDMVVHAPTGAILLQFRELCLFGRPIRVGDLLQPGFTHL